MPFRAARSPARFVGSRRTSAFLGPHIVREGGSGWKILYLAKFHQATTIAISRPTLCLPFSCVIGAHSLPLSCIAEVEIENLKIIFTLQPKIRKSFFHFLTVLARRREEGRRGGKEDQQIFVAFIYHGSSSRSSSWLEQSNISPHKSRKR